MDRQTELDSRSFYVTFCQEKKVADRISLEIVEKYKNAPLEMISTHCIEQLPTSSIINIKQRGHL